MPTFKTNLIRWLVTVAASNPTPPPTTYTPTHYASPNANEATSDGSYLNPWSFVEAMTAAGQGLVIGYLPGTYESLQPTPFNNPRAGLNPTAGAVGQPNIHVALYPVVNHLLNPELWTRWQLSSGTGAVVGMRSNVVYHGMDIQQNGTWSLGGTSYGEQYAVVVRAPDDSVVQNVRIERCRFSTVLSTGALPASNWGSIFMQNVSGVEVSDCLFENMPVGTNWNNIEMYSTDNYNIHHNLFRNGGYAMYVKGVFVPPTRNLTPGSVHHNHFDNMQYAFRPLGVNDGGDASELCLVYQNIATGWRHFINAVYGGTSAPSNMWFVNNTVVANGNLSGEAMFYFSGGANLAGNTVFSNSRWFNNIVRMNFPINLYFDYGTSTLTQLASRIQANGNVYNGVTQFFKGGSFTDWQNAGLDPNGTTADAQFVDYAGGNYRVQAGSSANNRGIDILNLKGAGTSGPIRSGAYITDDQSDVLGIRPAA